MGRFHLKVEAVLDAGITGIFGPSGAGKTTLLEIIAGLRRPQAGCLSIAGEVLFDLGKKFWLPPHRRNIGYVPQDLALFPHLNVRANISYGKKVSGREDASIALGVVSEVLEIEQLLTKFPEALSGGEKQRVAFARALIAQPRLLLLDEPLSSLDLALKEKMIPYLLRIRDEFKVPMIYVSHSANEIMALCQQVVLLREGKIRAQGAPADLFMKSDDPVYRLRGDLG